MSMEYARAFIVSTVIHHRCYQYWQTEHSTQKINQMNPRDLVRKIFFKRLPPLEMIINGRPWIFKKTILAIPHSKHVEPSVSKKRLKIQIRSWKAVNRKRNYRMTKRKTKTKEQYIKQNTTHRRDRGTQPQWKLWVKSDHHEFKLFAYYDKNTRRITVKWLKHILT